MKHSEALRGCEAAKNQRKRDLVTTSTHVRLIFAIIVAALLWSSLIYTTWIWSCANDWYHTMWMHGRGLGWAFPGSTQSRKTTHTFWLVCVSPVVKFYREKTTASSSHQEVIISGSFGEYQYMHGRCWATMIVSLTLCVLLKKRDCEKVEAHTCKIQR